MRQADEAFKAWLDECLKGIEPRVRSIVGKGEEHVPLMLVFEEGGKRRVSVISMVPFYAARDVSGKDIAARLHYEVAQRPEVAGAITINEGWGLMVEPGDPRANTDSSIAEEPGRVEVILVNARRRDMQLIVQWTIDREAKGLKDRKVVDPNGSEGFSRGRMIDAGRPAKDN